MFIQTEETPNPLTLKFLPGRDVLGQKKDTERLGVSFSAGERCDHAPLAGRILKVQGITGVYLGVDFISITKNADSEWMALKPALLGIIMDHYIHNMPIWTDPNSLETTQNKEDEGPKSAIWTQIHEIIETRVRPAVAQDGGDIRFCSFENGIVYVKMYGACSGCPSSTQTLKSGIENMLRYYVPEVQEVQQIMD